MYAILQKLSNGSFRVLFQTSDWQEILNEWQPYADKKILGIDDTVYALTWFIYDTEEVGHTALEG